MAALSYRCAWREPWLRDLFASSSKGTRSSEGMESCAADVDQRRPFRPWQPRLGGGPPQTPTAGGNCPRAAAEAPCTRPPRAPAPASVARVPAPRTLHPGALQMAGGGALLQVPRLRPSCRRLSGSTPLPPLPSLRPPSAPLQEATLGNHHNFHPTITTTAAVLHHRLPSAHHHASASHPSGRPPCQEA